MSDVDWKPRAEREAAAILAESGMFDGDYMRWSAYETMRTLVAIGWLQGAVFGGHETLSLLDEAFDELRAAL